MIPLRDNIPTRRFPVVCVTLIALNVIAYIMDHLVLRETRIALVQTRIGLVEVQTAVGGLSERYAMVPALVTAAFPEVWFTVLTSMFLHANLLHIGGNMLYLWVFGNNIEDALGRVQFIVFYLAGGALAAAAHIASGPGSDIPAVGASGAVAAVMGAYLLLYPNAAVLAVVPIFFIGTLMEVPALLVIGFWALVQFANAQWFGGGELRGGGVAYFAHLGGFLAGLLIVAMLGGRRLVRRQRARREQRGDW
ncbi:MAG TPA: rhomboid family intramembrane serine protease [Chthonomonadales bacterium]|nr:rhomboid family intramembrane serine protease [Chthonomonadales bacterium]